MARLARDAVPEQMRIRISPATRKVLEEIKRDCDLLSDAEVIRHALGLQRQMGRILAGGGRIFVADKAGDIQTELVFPHATGVPA